MSPWKIRPDSPVYTNLQDLKITQSSLPPLPSSSPLTTHADWETYQDVNGRHFYYNCTMQEHTWKPSRLQDSLGKREEKHITATTETEVLFTQTHRNYVWSVLISQYTQIHVPNIWKSIISHHQPLSLVINSEHFIPWCINHHNHPITSEMHDAIWDSLLS